MLARTFVKIRSSDNISEERKRGRVTAMAENTELIQHMEDTDNLLNKPLYKDRTEQLSQEIYNINRYSTK